MIREGEKVQMCWLTCDLYKSVMARDTLEKVKMCIMVKVRDEWQFKQ